MKIILILLLPLTVFFSIHSLGTCFISSEKTIGFSVQDTIGKEKVTTTKGYEARTKIISFTRIDTYMDSFYYPKSLYYNIRFTEILGINVTSANSGKITVKLFNDRNEELTLTKEPKFYAAKTFKTGDQINILFNIPLNPTDIKSKKYTYILTFQTSTGEQIINIRGKIGYK